MSGYRLEGGMVYVGRDLEPVEPGWNDSLEPALIRPDLRIDRSKPDREGESMPYWPSYSGVSPGARAAYLEWLAAGRRSPDAYVGYVFLFFYGIERRLLADAKAEKVVRNEAEALLKEVKELLAVYGQNSSFRGYAQGFLEAARLVYRPMKLSELTPPSTLEDQRWELPLSTKLALGTLATEDQPIPAKWALGWVFGSQVFRLRTPVLRCSDEFRRLFMLRYGEKFRNGGLKIRPNKTRLKAEYQPASPTFGRGAIELELPDLPDVTILKGPVRKLQELVDQVTDELDAYSRWVGRNDDRTSPAALALLPPEIAAANDSPKTKTFLADLRAALDENGQAVVEAARLIAFWPSNKPDRLTKRESTSLASFLGHRGIGLEPDCRFGGPPLGKAERAVLFDLAQVAPVSELTVSAEGRYQAQALLLHVAAAVAAADGEIAVDEEQHLEQYLAEVPELSGAESRRLGVHLRWLLAEPPSLAGVKRRVESLDSDQRQTLGRFVISVAGADGRIDPQEIKILRRIYPLLGLEADSVYSDVHSLIAGDRLDEGPVKVIAGGEIKGFDIPRPAAESDPAETAFVLDQDKIRATRQASERVSGVLAEIFEEDDELTEIASEVVVSETSVCGLDANHSAFLLELAKREQWQRVEIEQLAQRVGVLPDGALELINDAAVELCGDPVLEGDEEVEIDQEILKEMMA